MSRYTVEPHGDGWALYFGRESQSSERWPFGGVHGHNLVYLREPSRDFNPQIVADALNAYVAEQVNAHAERARLADRVEALVRWYLPRLREAVEDSLPDALAVPLGQDYPARVERGLLEPARALAAAVVALIGPCDESHDVEG